MARDQRLLWHTRRLLAAAGIAKDGTRLGQTWASRCMVEVPHTAKDGIQVGMGMDEQVHTGEERQEDSGCDSWEGAVRVPRL